MDDQLPQFKERDTFPRPEEIEPPWPGLEHRDDHVLVEIYLEDNLGISTSDWGRLEWKLREVLVRVYDVLSAIEEAVELALGGGDPKLADMRRAALTYLDDVIAADRRHEKGVGFHSELARRRRLDAAVVLRDALLPTLAAISQEGKIDPDSYTGAWVRERAAQVRRLLLKLRYLDPTSMETLRRALLGRGDRGFVPPGQTLIDRRSAVLPEDMRALQDKSPKKIASRISGRYFDLNPHEVETGHLRVRRPTKG